MEKTIKVGVLIVNKDKILLIKEWSENKNDYCWNIIKGTYDDSVDKQVLDCAIREAQEEANAAITVDGFINIVIKYGYNIRFYINFIASITNGEPHTASKNDQSLRKEDIKEVRWFTKTELKNMKEVEFINDVAFEAINKWINKEIYPLNLLTEKIMRI